MAREVEVDEMPGALDRVFKKMLKPTKVMPSAPPTRRTEKPTSS